MDTTLSKFLKGIDVLAPARTTLNPRQYDTMPPNYTGRVTFPNRFTLGGMWTISDVGLTGEQISTRNGLVVWLPWRGLNSMWRMALIPAGTVSVGSVIDGGGNITYSRNIAMPYNEEAGQIRIAQSVEKDFTVTRMVAARASVVGRALPIVQGTAITGKLAWGVVSDTRDLERLGWTPEAIEQQTPIKKDAALQQELVNGVEMILGCDIPQVFTAPNRDNYTTLNGEKHVFQLATDELPVQNIPAGTTVQSNLKIVSISPRGAQLGNANPLTEPLNTIYMEPISLGGQVRYYLFFMGMLTSAPTQQSGMTCMCTVHFADVFGAVGPNGQMVYQQTPAVGINCVIPPDTPLNTPVAFRVDHAALDNVYRFTVDGMYVGSRIRVSITNSGNAAFDMKLMYCFLAAEVLDTFAEGEVGPARVVRYDGVSEQQQIAVTGDLLVECVPEGNVAPFIIPTERCAPRATSSSIYNFLSIMYNTRTTIFRRMWNVPSYRKLCMEIVPNLTIDKLEAWDNDEGALIDAAHVFGLDGDRFAPTVSMKREREDENNRSVVSGVPPRNGYYMKRVSYCLIVYACVLFIVKLLHYSYCLSLVDDAASYQQLRCDEALR